MPVTRRQNAAAQRFHLRRLVVHVLERVSIQRECLIIVLGWQLLVLCDTSAKSQTPFEMRPRIRFCI